MNAHADISDIALEIGRSLKRAERSSMFSLRRIGDKGSCPKG